MVRFDMKPDETDEDVKEDTEEKTQDKEEHWELEEGQDMRRETGIYEGTEEELKLKIKILIGVVVVMAVALVYCIGLIVFNCLSIFCKKYYIVFICFVIYQNLILRV